MDSNDPLRLDTQGAVQGLPLSLVIAMVLVILVAPIAFEALHNFSESTSRSDIENELNRFNEIALVVYSSQSGGFTSSLTHKIEFSPASGVRIEHIRIGADLRGDEYYKANFTEYSIDGQAYMIMNSGQRFPIMVDGTGSLLIEDITTVFIRTLRLSLIEPNASESGLPCGGNEGIEVRFICVEVIDNA